MTDTKRTLSAITPLDGRYFDRVADLAELVSESGLIRERLRVEAGWLLWLADCEQVRDGLRLSDTLRKTLGNLADCPPEDAAQRVKAIEARTNHDVKAVEYYLREVLREAGAGDDVLSMIHFGCTSEDINNLAYALMLRAARDNILVPAMQRIIDGLAHLAAAWAAVPMLSRTHGQAATPTTVGKELAVFAFRLQRQLEQLSHQELFGKMNGAVGNYNAHVVAFPGLDWPSIAREFVEQFLGLKQNPLTTQIESHDTLLEYCAAVQRFNTILLGLCRDLWAYISIGYFRQKTKEGEVGSSTMPHKVNPIDFENAEGNLGVAGALLGHYADKLAVSRWQRDLSDSTVLRTLGTSLGHSLVAYKGFMVGLDKLELGTDRIAADLAEAWEVLAEPVQMVMRRYHVADAYERLKAASRGKTVTREAILAVIQATAELPGEAKEQLTALTPAMYTGEAERLTLRFCEDLAAIRRRERGDID